MDHKIGDRYQYYGYIFEITGLITDNNMYPCVCIKSETAGWSIGQAAKFFFRDGWKYLGNFGKSHNFNNLYAILNSGE